MDLATITIYVLCQQSKHSDWRVPRTANQATHNRRLPYSRLFIMDKQFVSIFQSLHTAGCLPFYGSYDWLRHGIGRLQVSLYLLVHSLLED
jgi:hypothetical protein